MLVMLVMLVSLLCCVPAAEACLQCDRTIRRLHEDYILSASKIKDQIELKKIRDQGYLTYRETSQKQKGVIDPTTQYRAKTEYQVEYDRFMKNPPSGSVTHRGIQLMEKGRKILEKHLNTFIPTELCPNQCGFLIRRVMDCVTCRYKSYNCPAPSGQLDCGEHPVHAEEGSQAVFNCFLSWHILLLGKPEYHYSWAKGVIGTKKLVESDFKTLVVTQDSSVVLNQLHVEEQGIYRCCLQDRDGTIYYRVTFPLNVTSLPLQTRRPFVALPSLPPEDISVTFESSDDLLVPLIAMVTGLGLIASAGLTVVLGMMINQQRAAKELKRRREESY